MFKHVVARSGGHHTALLIPLLGALAAFAPLSIDTYLPSLPQLASEFRATAGQVQLTLSAFFVGFALGQLCYGPLSDYYGRKPVLIVGLSVYAVTSLLCVVSSRIEALTVLRFLQALGGGAGTVIARAMVRDLYDRDRTARVLSMIMLVTALAPLIAPLLGGYLLHWSGWRAIFGLLATLGLVCLTVVVLLLPESHPPERRHRDRLTQLVHDYATVVGQLHNGSAVPMAAVIAATGVLSWGVQRLFLQQRSTARAVADAVAPAGPDHVCLTDKQ